MAPMAAATTPSTASAGATAPAQSTTAPAAAPVQTNVAATQSFDSAPDLKPPAVKISTPDGDPSSGYVFVDSQFAPQNGPMILDFSGNVVRFDPLPDNEWAMDVKVQRYDGKPVLTWWQGPGRLCPVALSAGGPPIASPLLDPRSLWSALCQSSDRVWQ